MTRIGIYLAHPAHFHLFKNVVNTLSINHEVFIVYNDKDVLQELINSSGFHNKSYRVKTNKQVNSKPALFFQFILKTWGAFRLFHKLKPDIVIGTPILISLIGRILPYKCIIVNEDDFDVVKKTSNFGYPYADHILCPVICRTTNFDSKSIKYQGYHELAYLHPNHFKAKEEIASKYVDLTSSYFIIRFAKLIAHHDDGIKGLDNDIAKQIIEILKAHGNVYITSERPLDREFEPYRITIHAKDMHHVMAFAKIYIGDSQTMAAEAGVLGVPFIRFNDFVGRISYLDELENKYHLGFGIKTNEVDKLLSTIKKLVSNDNLREKYQAKRQKMLSDKIDYAAFLNWFLENYPSSVDIMKKNPNYQYNFK
jgi:predicted glycosyltransferase